MRNTSERITSNYVDEFLRMLINDGLDVRPMEVDNRYLVTDDSSQDIAISIVTIFQRSSDARLLSLKFDQLINSPEVELSKRVLDLWKKFVDKYYEDWS